MFITFNLRSFCNTKLTEKLSVAIALRTRNFDVKIHMTEITRTIQIKCRGHTKKYIYSMEKKLAVLLFCDTHKLHRSDKRSSAHKAQ